MVDRPDIDRPLPADPALPDDVDPIIPNDIDSDDIPQRPERPL